ncbi:granulocyte colony-stimulating factor receptor [Aythya fuligula]|uniref:Granulocyte colony-stimulating factor receptor n=1 Tax=Aythya fuligula TaxID=219594 RepID=A0A6J3E9N2_AYTFU|nr:granulocyte colony-stimulating factor receptor [Aythya fuligula]
MARRGVGTPLLLLRLSLLLLLRLGGTLGCASVEVGSPVVPLGSAVTASCSVRSRLCRGLQGGRARISWMLDNETVAGSQGCGGGDTEVSNLTLPQFNRTQAKLWCWVEWNGTKQRVGLAEIRAGYPPAKPSNLSCLLNLSDYGLTCRWQPGADSLLPTSVVLKCSTSRAPAVTGCTPQGGRSHCTVPRRLLQLYGQMEIWVAASNALGTAESERLRLDPMDVAQLEPPALRSIQSVPPQTDCVTLAWAVAPSSAHMELWCELRYRPPEDPNWVLVTGIVGQAGTAQCCGLLFGTPYLFQMRCRRHSARGHWSEWSAARNHTTHEKAPTGKLDAWWSTRPDPVGRRLEVQLRWKAPRQREANGRLLGYRVALGPRRRGREPPTVCNTSDTHCDFTAPAGTRRVYLSAYNAAGESAATEVVLLERKGQPLAGLRAEPAGERSLWVHWEAPRAPVAAYVLEWQRVASEPGRCSACWQMQRDGAATSALIQGGIEPFQRYNISVCPLYKDAVGTPAHTAAYSRQKAPSHAPKLHLKSISKAHAELCWDPVAVELQNGFITNYTIFWANSTAEVASAVVNSSFNSFIIRDLKPSTLYKVHIMASTVGGSTNGTSLTLVTMVLDDIEIQILFLTLGLIFVLLTALLICFQKNGRVKQQFWPSVPDPANSSLGKWVPAELQQEPPQVPSAKEPGLATISTVTVLERAAGKQAPVWGKDPPAETTVAFPGVPQPYVQQDSPSRATGPGTGSYGSGETVQYAQVAGDGYKGQQHVPCRLYLRSSSTQPLLFDRSPSPKPYENLWFHGAAPSHGCRGAGCFSEEALIDFPLLQGLQISGAEELHDFQRC